MRLYISGPMKNYPNFNHEMFDAVAEHLRQMGHEVFSPAEYVRGIYGQDFFKCLTGDAKSARERGFDLEKALTDYFTFIVGDCEMVVFLPGWEYSEGATWEWKTTVTVKKPCLYLSHGHSMTMILHNGGTVGNFAAQEFMSFNKKKEPVWN